MAWQRLVTMICHNAVICGYCDTDGSSPLLPAAVGDSALSPPSWLSTWRIPGSSIISVESTLVLGTYTFDLANGLIKACTGSSCTSTSTYTFAYDGLGDRIRETGPSGSKTFNNTVVASGGEMLYLKNVVGTTTTKTAYLYAGSLLVATVSGTTTSYVHEDHLGDTRLVTQAGHGGSVNVVFSTNYLPFGIQYAASGTVPHLNQTEQD